VQTTWACQSDAWIFYKNILTRVSSHWLLPESNYFVTTMTQEEHVILKIYHNIGDEVKTENSSPIISWITKAKNAHCFVCKPRGLVNLMLGYFIKISSLESLVTDCYLSRIILSQRWLGSSLHKIDSQCNTCWIESPKIVIRVIGPRHTITATDYSTFCTQRSGQFSWRDWRRILSSNIHPFHLLFLLKGYTYGINWYSKRQS